MLILKPIQASAPYEKAANIFHDMYLKVTGTDLPICEQDSSEGDLVVIGSDAVNDFLLGEVLEYGLDLGIRYGTDDYCIRSYKRHGRRILILAGGNGRATLYAVYDFFERFADCHYFWDGDVIPQKETITWGDIEILESPRFEYRGQRYFAHRGLKRFQAEHWSFEDWRHELDYLIKKRLNFFMLRIGMDDAWQRAFPDDVPYPDGFREITSRGGFDNRSDFWTLRYRGELRKKVQQYARDLDLISPTDCGTMTHWYSPTPKEYLDKHTIRFLGQADHQYNGTDGGKVWDFRIKENMDRYMCLTETMAKEYDQNDHYFHTIGLGERKMYDDPRKNHALKLLCYRRICESLRERYPHSKLFIASWDFIGWWKGCEVEKLVKEFDPRRTVILDYTSECDDPEQSFLNWGVIGKFPWIFGLFHAYESESELRGPYARTTERLKLAADDPMCQGMILWPELAHSDPLVLEFLSENAWAPLAKDITDIVRDFSYKRYGARAELMNDIWQQFLPFMQQGSWGGYSTRHDDDKNKVQFYNSWYSHSDIWTKILHVFPKIRHDKWYQKQSEQKIATAKEHARALVEIIKTLGEQPSLWEDQFSRRDAIDIIRTICGRYLDFAYARAVFYQEDRVLVTSLEHNVKPLLASLYDLLCLNDDFSMYHTLLHLQNTAPCNPNFEKVLKQNIEDEYCRQYCSEQIRALYIPECNVFFDWLNSHQKSDEFNVREKKEEIINNYMDIPLRSMQPDSFIDPKSLTVKIANLIEKISYLF